MPNAKGQVEMDELSSDMSSYDARVSVNEDFHSFLNQLDFSKETRCIGDIIIEYATEKADNIDINELTLQLWASQYGNNDIVKYLIEQGAEVNKTQNFNRDYPLVLATKQGNIDIVKTLIVKGADLNIKNQNNETALTIAQKLNNKELVTLLKGHKALEQAIQKSKQKTTKLQKTKSKSNDFGMNM